MKITLLLLIFLPLASFGQLTKKEKKSIENYALNICDCMNGVLSELQPQTLDILKIISDNEEDEALEYLNELTANMSIEELQVLADL